MHDAINTVSSLCVAVPLCLEDMTSLLLPTTSGSYTFSALPSIIAPEKKKKCGIYVLFRAEHSIVFPSLYLDQFWISMIFTTYFK